MGFYFSRHQIFSDKKEKPCFSDFSGSISSFNWGRTALYGGLKNFQNELQQGPVLVPEFICEEALKPFTEMNISTVKYKLNRHLDPKDLEQEILRTKPRGLMIVHYFGIPRNFELSLQLAKKYKIILIEDNAHGFGGHWQGRALGDFGDFSLQSIRKNLPVTDGALLVSRKPPTEEFLAWQSQLPPDNSSTECPKMIVKSKIKDFLFQQKIFRWIYANRRITNFYRISKADFLCATMTKKTQDQLKKLDIPNRTRLRQQQFRAWVSWCQKQKFTPVIPDCLEAAPLVCAFWVSSLQTRDLLLKRLFIAGIDAHPWPQQQEGVTYWERMICLPINPDISLEIFKKKLQQWETIPWA